MNQLYSDNTFKIYHSRNGYIIHNYRKEHFSHTHLKNYKTCIYLIRLIHARRIPRNISAYLLESLRRISPDDDYTEKIIAIQNARANRRQTYRNGKKNR